MMTTAIQNDYQDTLQEAALHFLRRHKDEHLRVGEQELFSRAVSHLVVTFGAKQQVAENIVARAYGEVHPPEGEKYMDMTRSTSNVAMLVDPRSGQHFVVPVSLIFQQIIQNPARRKLAAVK